MIRLITISFLFLAFGVSAASSAQSERGVPNALRYVGAEAIGSDGKRLGVIDNFLVKSDGQVQAALINVKGFLGLVDCNMAVPWEKLQRSDDVRKVNIDMTRVEFNSLPIWEPKNTVGLRLARPG